MTLEGKMKRTALSTALSYLLKGKDKAIDRTARNILELSITLSRSILTESEKEELREELKDLLVKKENPAIYSWILQKFNL